MANIAFCAFAVFAKKQRRWRFVIEHEETRNNILKDFYTAYILNIL